jgi:hypothetical protein
VTDGPVLRRADDIPETGLTVRDMVLNHEARLRAVEDWRVEMRTLAVILKTTFGVSSARPSVTWWPQSVSPFWLR